MHTRRIFSHFSIYPRLSKRRHYSTQRRCFFVLLIGLIVGFVELGGLIPLVPASRAAAANSLETSGLSANGAISTFPWNLNDEDKPLISLPDHLNGNLDFSFTYSMGQFQFPLFQSLYFNERVGKYILMVIPNGALRAQFIDLEPVAGLTRFESKGDLGLRLADSGRLKLLSTNAGTTYTFATLADGELHCNQINETDGLAISLTYTDDSSIETISDSSGRSIRFSYTNKYLSGVTQTWVSEAGRLSRTWELGVGLTTGPGRASVAYRESKRMPSNAIQPAYTDQMAKSDWTLARIFGGPGAIAAANGFEPRGLARQYPLYRGDLIGDDGRVRRGHLSYAMHLYGSEDGTRGMELYVPAGFVFSSTEPSPTDAAVTFYYPRLGSLTDVTLAVFHVANFHLTYEGGRVRIGNIGGPGGSVASYKHSHIEFYRGDTGLPPSSIRPQLRIDPATIVNSISR